MNFNEVFIGAIIAFVFVLLCSIIITILRSESLKVFGEKEIFKLEMQLAFEQEKSVKLLEREKLSDTLNMSLRQRILKIFEKMILLQKFIFETYS